MSSVGEFETFLKEVVTGKRLSQSKTIKLNEIAMKHMSNDSQLVSALYRTHKTLAPANKIASLYVFDSLARAARSQVNKFKVTLPAPGAAKGNSAGFLLKMEGVLEGLFTDLINTQGVPEVKEKARKILDIWTKGSTFPPAVLQRLLDLVNGTAITNEKVAAPPVTDPRLPPGAPIAPVQPVVSNGTPPMVNSLQPVQPVQPVIPPHILALLGGALASAAQQQHKVETHSSSNGSPVPALDAAQLAVLEQLGRLVPGAANPLPSVAPPVLQSGIGAVNNTSYDGPPNNNYRTSGQHQSHSPPRPTSRWDSGPSRDSRNYRDDRYERRGGSSEGNFRGHDPRRGSRRSSSRSRSPPLRRTNERGRSTQFGPPLRRHSPPPPPRYASPPRVRSPIPARVPPPGAQTLGKDEFGRDIREVSPDSDTPPVRRVRSPGPSSTPSTILPATVTPSAGPSSAVGAASLSKNASAQTPGLAQFDFATFNPTAPTSWEALGVAYTVTHGRAPTQEEMMTLVMGNMGGIGPSTMEMEMGDAPAVQRPIQKAAPARVSIQQQGQPISVWEPPAQSGNGSSAYYSQGGGEWGGGSRGGGYRGRGRGGHGGSYGGGYSGGYGGGQHAYNETDAIVLGGGGDEVDDGSVMPTGMMG